MTFTKTLHPYQEEAVERMVDRRAMLVAYAMGTGKTPMSIAAIESLRDAGEIEQPVLVVCLSSLKYQWQKEIAKFSDSTSIVIDGTPKQRHAQYEEAIRHDYVIVNYEQVVGDWDVVHALPLSGVVADEVGAIKSFRAQRAKRMKDLGRRVDVRFGLTGTPMENGRPEELYSIMQFVDPVVLGKRFDLFDQTFIVRNKWGGVERYRNLPTLHAKLKEATVRKKQTDPDVAPFMPDTIEREPVLVPFDRHGAVVYRSIAAMLLDDLEEAMEAFGMSWSVEAHYGDGHEQWNPAEMEMRGRVMSKIMALRMLCDHPRLLLTSAEKWNPMEDGEGSKFLSDLLADDASIRDHLARAKSPKLDVLKSMVNDHLVEEQNKVVVFCSYVEMATMIQEAVGGVVYTGRMNAKEKEAAKTKFQTQPDCRVFISTDAGGYGVDLPQANLLINYDLPWSSGLAVQRNSRIKRVSSTWPSIVIQDVLMAESTEERQHAVLRQKNAVSDAVIDGMGINADGGVDMTVGALAAYLRETQP